MKKKLQIISLILAATQFGGAMDEPMEEEGGRGIKRSYDDAGFAQQDQKRLSSKTLSEIENSASSFSNKLQYSDGGFYWSIPAEDYTNQYPRIYDNMELFLKAGLQDKNLPNVKMQLRKFFKIRRQEPSNLETLASSVSGDIQECLKVLIPCSALLTNLMMMNDEKGSLNTQGDKQGRAIAYLYPHFKRCSDFAILIENILYHLESEEAMEKGFLVNNVNINSDNYCSHFDLRLEINHHSGLIKRSGNVLPRKNAKFIHVLRGLSVSSHENLFSFENSNNIKFAKLVDKISYDESDLNCDLEKSLTFLKNIYSVRINNSVARAMELQDLYNAAGKTEWKNYAAQIERQNEIIKINEQSNADILQAFENLSFIKHSLIKIIEKSTPLRNHAFLENKEFWDIFSED